MVKLREKPYLDMYDEYGDLLKSADKRNLKKLKKIVKKLGRKEIFDDDMWELCLWLDLGYKERLELSKKIRKSQIGVTKICIQKIESILEENSELEWLAKIDLNKKELIKGKKNLKERLDYLKNKTKAGHLKELIECFSSVLMPFFFHKSATQKDQVDWIYELMKNFSFEWGIGYKVVKIKSKKSVKTFEGKYEAEEYIKKLDSPDTYIIEEVGLTVEQIPTVKDRIRVQIQQVGKREYVDCIQLSKNYPEV